MGRVVEFPGNCSGSVAAAKNLADRKAEKPKQEDILVAKSLITRAAVILSEMGGGTERVSWLLEECREMLDTGRC